MSETNAINMRSRIKELKKTAHMERTASKHLRKLNQTEAQEMAFKLERSSLKKLELAESLKVHLRLDALSVYKVEIAKRVRKGEYKNYAYWYASWRTDEKVKTVYIGPINKMSFEDAFKKARKLKAKDLDLDL